ncbi:MAG: hypothetical protein ACLP19_05260 [Xanthobacteraceae bacterium]
MTGLESAMRNARTKNPAAFDAALRAMAKDSKRRPSRFARALRARFGGDPKKVMSALGMDANLLGEIRNEKSRSVMDDERAHKMMAEHGHAVDDEEEGERVEEFDMRPFAKILAEKGLGSDDVEEVMDALHHHLHEHHHHAHDDEETERNLESEKNERLSATNYPRRDMERARSTEHVMSQQSEDRRRYSKDRLPKNHFAHDEADFAVMYPSAMNIGTAMSGVNPERSVGPNNFNMNSMDSRAALLDELRRLER